MIIISLNLCNCVWAISNRKWITTLMIQPTTIYARKKAIVPCFELSNQSRHSARSDSSVPFFLVPFSKTKKGTTRIAPPMLIRHHRNTSKYNCTFIFHRSARYLRKIHKRHASFAPVLAFCNAVADRQRRSPNRCTAKNLHGKMLGLAKKPS